MSDTKAQTDLECGYCCGRVVWDDEKIAYVHVDSGDRVKPGVFGDFVSERHNHAGSTVNPVDVVEAES